MLEITERVQNLHTVFQVIQLLAGVIVHAVLCAALDDVAHGHEYAEARLQNSPPRCGITCPLPHCSMCNKITETIRTV